MVAGALVVTDGLGEPLVRIQAGGAHPRSAAARSSAASSRRTTPRPRAPLTVWFAVCWAFASQRDGVSALGLRRTLETGSYQTAWAMLHRLRAGMVRPGRDRLTGTVEMDGTHLGGVTPGKRGRQGRECCCHRAQGAAGLRSVPARRRSTSHGLLFYRVLELAVGHDPVRDGRLVTGSVSKKAPPIPPSKRVHPTSLDRPRVVHPWRAAS